MAWLVEGGGEGGFLERYHPNMLSLAKQGSFRGEAAFSVQIFPWETEFMNNALWSPRGAQAGERTRTAGGTVFTEATAQPKQAIVKQREDRALAQHAE